MISLEDAQNVVHEASHFNPSVKVDKANFIWEIEHYTTYYIKGSPLKSPLFPSDASSQFKWYLKLYNSENDSAESRISVFLYLDSSSHHNTAFARPKLFIIDKDQNRSYGKLGSVHEYTVSPEYGYQHPRGWTEFIKRGQLFNDKFLPNDKLTLCCEVSFFRVGEDLMDKIGDRYDSFLMQPNVPKYDLSEDLKLLLENEQLADLVLSANGKEYQVHKAILAARSPVFAAMFQHNMKENENSRIDITDVEETIVPEMLRYIYTGTCENLKDLADSLMIVADKYDLAGLKTMCENALIENLSVENATHTLVLADLHHADKLKSKTLNFIVSKSSKVMKTKGWTRLKRFAPSNPQVIIEVSEALSKALHKEKKIHDRGKIRLPRSRPRTSATWGLSALAN